MRKSTRRFSLDRPAMYRIEVGGRLGERWSDQFAGMTITVGKTEDGLAVTTLSGVLADQASLSGLLSRIRDLGLPLLLVLRLEDEVEADVILSTAKNGDRQQG